MSRYGSKNTGKISIRDAFVKDLKSAIGSRQETSNFDTRIWKFKPVSLKKFCRDYVREPLFPLQYQFGVAMNGTKPTQFSTRFDEGHAFWGKGSGKDRTIAKLHAYMVYKLMCLKNPQWFLRTFYNASLGDGDAIDTGNMSINSKQAKNVYFKKLKQIVTATINPETGKNWFGENGVDLRDGQDILEYEIKFPNGITAHSLNSVTHTGEGLNLFFSSIDEFGVFPVTAGFELLEAIRDTTTSRFPLVGKVFVMSYMYNENDAMDVLYREGLKDKRTFSSRHATFEVNTQRSKADFSKKYIKNPESAKMTYECKSSGKVGGYFKKKYLLSKMFDEDFEHPIIGNLDSVLYTKLHSLKFRDFFKGNPDTIYVARFDLASGKVKEKRDTVGFSLMHFERMKPTLDSRMIRELAAEGIYVELNDEELNVVRKGVIIDLSLQITAPPDDEVQITLLRNWMLDVLVNKYGFNIRYVSYDQWQSTESVQVLNSKGIVAEVLSVDSNNDAYEQWKTLGYQQLIKTYPNRIAKREAKELVVDEKGKVDHPELSNERMATEGIDKGSKDIMDAIVGGIKQGFEIVPLEATVAFG